MPAKEKVRAWVFYGTVPYGIHVAVARTLEKAARLVGVPVEKCVPWPDFKPKHPYQYQILEEGDCEEYAE